MKNGVQVNVGPELEAEAGAAEVRRRCSGGWMANVFRLYVDLVIGLGIDDAPETYTTLQANLKKSGFRQTVLDHDFPSQFSAGADHHRIA